MCAMDPALLFDKARPHPNPTRIRTRTPTPTPTPNLREVERALQRLAARQGDAARREVIQAALRMEDAPRKVYASDDCVICLEALPQAEAQPLRCGHAFHPHCIAEWCSRAGGAGGGAPRCPTCMQPISWRRALVDRALLVEE